jgi:hypothetical protein
MSSATALDNFEVFCAALAEVGHSPVRVLDRDKVKPLAEHGWMTVAYWPLDHLVPADVTRKAKEISGFEFHTLATHPTYEIVYCPECHTSAPVALSLPPWTPRDYRPYPRNINTTDAWLRYYA